MNSLAKKAVLILAVVPLVLAAFVLFNQLTSATIIDCSESGIAQLAYQAGEGLPLYTETPGERLVNLYYTPLAMQATGMISRFFGYDIRAMRFVVAVFGLTAIFFMGLTIYQLTQNKYFAFVGACLYFGIQVPWYVQLGPNGVHTCFAWIAVYLLVRDRSLRWGTVVAVTAALFASFWSKQTGLAYLAAGLFYFWLSNRNKALAATILAVSLVTGSIMYYVNQPDSTFIKLTAFGHSDVPIMWSRLLTPTLYPELLGGFGVMLCAVLTGLAGNGLKINKWLAPEYIFFGASAFVGILTSLKYGSGSSQAILFHGMIVCLGLSFLHRFYQEKMISGVLALAMIAVQSLVLLALAAQCAPCFITEADTARYRQIINILRTPGKKVYYHPGGFLNFYAGKPLNNFAIVRWSCWNKGKFDNSGPPEVREYLRKDPYDIVIIDIPLEDTARPLYERLNESYQAVQEIPADPRGPTASIRNRKVIFMRKVDLKAKK